MIGWRRISLATVVLAGLLTGCGGGGSGPTATVSGTVMLDGQPLADAEVQLVPKDAGLGLHVGKTDAAGKFTITQDASNNPVKPGKYVVLVSKVTGGNDPSAPGGGMGAQKNLVPPAYQDRNKSPLSADVGPGSTALQPFEITTPAKAGK